ncbi:MAG: PilZ domain-containing protein [Planctomycetes bacterium]|nr:PilZ domain-containing protein [Planctomycetota bacterium]
MDTQQRETRRHLVYYLEVYDSDTDTLLGHLADITVSGIKIIGEEPLNSDTVYNLRIVWKQSERIEEDIDIEAECLWCGKDVNPSLHASGLRFINPSPLIRRHIESIINQIGFRDME